MSRKIIQISANQFGTFALADDGTVWAMSANGQRRQWGPWEQLPRLPENDDEAARQVTERRDPVRRTLFGIPLPRISGI